MGSKFGGPDFVIAHELGHLLDFRYGLVQRLKNDPAVWKEVGKLALRRVGNNASPEYLQYILNDRERIANLIHGYTYAPEALERIAPNAKKQLEQIISLHPELHELRTIRPGFELGSDTKEEFMGLTKAGEYAAPENTARVLNNHLSRSAVRGAAGGAIDMARSTGTAMNMAQLSLSAFHAGMTTIDAMSSQVSIALKEASAGHFGTAFNKFITAIPAAGVTSFIKGNKLREAILNPGNASPELQKMVQAFELAGGRVSMPRYYGVTGAGSYVPALARAIETRNPRHFFNDLAKNFESDKAGAGPAIFKGIARTLGRTVESSSHWLMDYFVPRQKLGVFYDMCALELKKNPNLKSHELIEAMQKSWDSVDNRMGQLVYDNLFWNKTLRDCSHIAIRSVGWNLGTIRELGGGGWDWIKAANEFVQGGNPEMTHRMAYTGGFAYTAAVIGATTQYLMTGKPPTEMLDYYFPKTGGTTRDGQPERLSLPTYAKDVIEWGRDPLNTGANKLAPWVAFAHDLGRNRDYYGAFIYDPDDPFLDRTADVVGYFAKQWVPFPIRNVQNAPPDSAIPKWAQFVGAVRAPRAVTQPDALHNSAEDKMARRKRLRERAQDQ
jgi:hypothetical protein